MYENSPIIVRLLLKIHPRVSHNRHLRHTMLVTFDRGFPLSSSLWHKCVKLTFVQTVHWAECTFFQHKSFSGIFSLSSVSTGSDRQLFDAPADLD